jgi:putative acetyltransferase
MIRAATPRDYAAIRAILRHAFSTEGEGDLVERLRADGDVLSEFVAASDIALHGHILLSRLRIERGEDAFIAAALAPVAVLPAFQRRRIGAALIEAAITECHAREIPAIVVLGHAKYYPRFGFSAEAAAPLEAPFSGPHFMALELAPGCLREGGRVRYAAAFGIAA